MPPFCAGSPSFRRPTGAIVGLTANLGQVFVRPTSDHYEPSRFAVERLSTDRPRARIPLSFDPPGGRLHRPEGLEGPLCLAFLGEADHHVEDDYGQDRDGIHALTHPC